MIRYSALISTLSCFLIDNASPNSFKAIDATAPALRGGSEPSSSSSGTDQHRSLQTPQQGPGVFLFEFEDSGGYATGFSCTVLSHMVSPGAPLGSISCFLADLGQYGVIQFANVTKCTASAEVAEYFSRGLQSYQMWLVGSDSASSFDPSRTPLDYAAFLNITIEQSDFPRVVQLNEFRIGYGSSGGDWWIGGSAGGDVSNDDDLQQYMSQEYFEWASSHSLKPCMAAAANSCVDLG